MTSLSHPAVGVNRLPWWAIAVTLLALFVAYAVLQENGVALGSTAQTLHEFFHDGRHALGVPCH